MVKMLDTYHKLSQQDMESFEAKNNVELTNNYKTFLLKWNGGTPDPGVFVISEWEGTTVMNYFYSIGDTDNDFEVYLDIYELRLPAGLDRKCTRLNSSHVAKWYGVFCLNKTI